MFKKEKKENFNLSINIENINSEVIKSFLKMETENSQVEYEVINTPLKGERNILIDIKNLRKEFGKLNKTKVVLHDISFQIREGESIGILGGMHVCGYIFESI